MVVKSRVLRSAANGELHSPVDTEEKPKRSRVPTHGRKNAKVAAPKGDSVEPSPPRRTSARIQIKLLAEKEQLVRQRVELLDKPDSASKRKKTNDQVRSRRNAVSDGGKTAEDNDNDNVVSVSKDVTKHKDDNASEPREMCSPEKSKALVDGAPASLVEKSDHVKVKETLRLFNKHYLHFVQVCRVGKCHFEDLFEVCSQLTVGFCLFI